MGSAPFLITGPHGSLGWLWLVGGQCYEAQVLVPCCQRLAGPAGSQTGCVCVLASVCVCVCVPSPPLYSSYTVKTLLSTWHATGPSKTYSQNICKPKWL